MDIILLQRDQTVTTIERVNQLLGYLSQAGMLLGPDIIVDHLFAQCSTIILDETTKPNESELSTMLIYMKRAHVYQPEVLDHITRYVKDIIFIFVFKRLLITYILVSNCSKCYF